MIIENCIADSLPEICWREANHLLLYFRKFHWIDLYIDLYPFHWRKVLYRSHPFKPCCMPFYSFSHVFFYSIFKATLYLFLSFPHSVPFFVSISVLLYFEHLSFLFKTPLRRASNINVITRIFIVVRIGATAFNASCIFWACCERILLQSMERGATETGKEITLWREKLFCLFS